LKRIQISRELRRTKFDGDYVNTRHVNRMEQKTTTDDDDDDDGNVDVNFF